VQEQEAKDQLGPQIPVEIFFVPFANTCPDKRAVVVVRKDALFTEPAMLRPEGLGHITFSTVP